MRVTIDADTSRQRLSVPVVIRRVLLPASEAVGFAQGFIASFLGGLDLFNLWALALCVLGMSVVSGVSTRKVGMTFGIGYLLIILVWSLLAGARTPS